MGIISEGLFATPETAVIRLSELPDEIRMGIECYMDNPIFGDKDVYTVNEFMKGFTYTKIYGYMTFSFWNTWESFLLHVARMNPDVPRIDLHFYCKDEMVPYILTVQDGRCWFSEYSNDITQRMWVKTERYGISEEAEAEDDDEAEGETHTEADAESESADEYYEEEHVLDVDAYRSSFKDVCCVVKDVESMKESSLKLENMMSRVFRFTGNMF
jgi:hypothetical protein